jgi:hypothetical protein
MGCGWQGSQDVGRFNMETKLARKRRMRRLRRDGNQLRTQFIAQWGPICREIERELPDGYRAYWNHETQGIVVERYGWFEQAVIRQIANDSHWLNDRGVFA